MLKFFHTSDWHFGLRTQKTATVEHANTKIRNARLETLEKIKVLAQQHQIHFMLMAGDIFDHHHVDLNTIHKVIHILNDFTCPIYIIAGNHDYHNLKKESIYFHSAFKSLKSHVHLILEPKIIQNDEHHYVLWNAPLSTYSSSENATLAFYPFKNQIHPENYFKIGMAHGSLINAYYTEDADFPINESCVDEYQLDYLALGHWHSQLITANNRVAYSGTPEPTQFGERDSGNILLVELNSPKSMPQLTKIQTKTLNWLTIDQDLTEYSDEKLNKIRQQIDNLTQANQALCRLTLSGVIPPSLNHELVNLRHFIETKGLIYSQIDTHQVRFLLDHQELDTMLSQSNILKNIYLELLNRQNNEQSEEDSEILEYALEFINTSMSMHQKNNNT